MLKTSKSIGSTIKPEKGKVKVDNNGRVEYDGIDDGITHFNT